MIVWLRSLSLSLSPPPSLPPSLSLSCSRFLSSLSSLSHFPKLNIPLAWEQSASGAQPHCLNAPGWCLGLFFLRCADWNNTWGKKEKKEEKEEKKSQYPSSSVHTSLCFFQLSFRATSKMTEAKGARRVKLVGV